MNIKRRTYHLEVCPGDSLQGPSDAEIEKAVRGLPGGVPSFVVLRKQKHHFMQVGGGGSEGFQLEYQEYSRDGLWEHKDLPGNGVDIETVVKALVCYAGDDDQWRDLPWVRLSQKESEARAAAAREAWEAEQPQAGVVKTIVGTAIGLLLVGLGIGGKKR